MKLRKWKRRSSDLLSRLDILSYQYHTSFHIMDRERERESLFTKPSCPFWEIYFWKLSPIAQPAIREVYDDNNSISCRVSTKSFRNTYSVLLMNVNLSWSSVDSERLTWRIGRNTQNTNITKKIAMLSDGSGKLWIPSTKKREQGMSTISSKQPRRQPLVLWFVTPGLLRMYFQRPDPNKFRELGFPPSLYAGIRINFGLCFA